jgi:hypothetical protein
MKGSNYASKNNKGNTMVLKENLKDLTERLDALRRYL